MSKLLWIPRFASQKMDRGETCSKLVIMRVLMLIIAKAHHNRFTQARWQSPAISEQFIQAY